MKKSYLTILSCAVTLSCLSMSALAGGGDGHHHRGERPNILFIVADDLGYTDIGAYGGEIATPNIDTLAAGGQQYTDFHAAPTCSLTRSMLLSGTDNHLAGLGNMAEALLPFQIGQPGYEGYLNNRVVSLATILRDEAHYHTYMAGKWHLGMEADQSPSARGFEQTFALLNGASSHFDDKTGLIEADVIQYRQNGEMVESLPADFFSTEFYTDKIIENIESNRNDGKPFFAYLAYTAPHSPLHVPDEWLDRYAGVYDAGYNAIQAQRLARLKQLNLVDQDVVAAPLPAAPWMALTPEQKALSARKMEIYASMVENMDYHIGRVIDYLKATGQYENTLIVFMSDNGAEMQEPEFYPGNDVCCWLMDTFDNSMENIGKKYSFVSRGIAWASVASAPMRGFKGTITEGGIKVPLIVSGPRVESGAVVDAFATAMDIAPTFLRIAGVPEPDAYNMAGIEQPRGKSMNKVFSGKDDEVHGSGEKVGWEFLNSRAIRKGDWKLVAEQPRFGPVGPWKLFNLADDPAELNDLRAQEPDIFDAMVQDYYDYAAEVGVVPFPGPVPQ